MKLYESKILIIETMETNTKTITKILENSGGNIESAHSLIEAIETIKYNIPDLIIINLSLLKNSNINFLHIKNKNNILKDIPVIALINDTGAIAIKKTLSMGLDDFLELPLRASEIIRKSKLLLSNVDYQSINFSIDKYYDAKIIVSGEIVKISETSCLIESSVKFSNPIKLEITNSIFSKINNSSMLVKSFNNSATLEASVYLTEFLILGINNEMGQKIRKLQMGMKI